MKKYNYFYYGQSISKEQFINEVPDGWENEVNELGEYSWEGYRAIIRD